MPLLPRDVLWSFERILLEPFVFYVDKDLMICPTWIDQACNIGVRVESSSIHMNLSGS